MISNLIHRIKRKWMKLRLQPIRVFCFHQTSETYDPEVYCQPDWIPTSFLKKYVEELRTDGYSFITLEDAHKHIMCDFVRRKKYAVLTCDDGLLCQLELLPWLEEQNIPITFFVDLETLDGKICTEPVKAYFGIMSDKEEHKHAVQLFSTGEQLAQINSPMLSIGMHGVKHNTVQNMNAEELQRQVELCQDVLHQYGINVIPFFAYPYGAHAYVNDTTLNAMGIIPVLANGEVNYNDEKLIHREIIDYIYKCRSNQL